MLHPITNEEKEQIANEKEMITLGDTLTICEILRQIYKIGKGQNNKQLQDLTRTAYVYAKRMNKKLREYKQDYDAGWWELKEKK